MARSALQIWKWQLIGMTNELLIPPVHVDNNVFICVRGRALAILLLLLLLFLLSRAQQLRFALLACCHWLFRKRTRANDIRTFFLTCLSH